MILSFLPGYANNPGGSTVKTIAVEAVIPMAS
jgi:hypothetical protein